MQPAGQKSLKRKVEKAKRPTAPKTNMPSGGAANMLTPDALAAISRMVARPNAGGGGGGGGGGGFSLPQQNMRQNLPRGSLPTSSYNNKKDNDMGGLNLGGLNVNNMLAGILGGQNPNILNALAAPNMMQKDTQDRPDVAD
eukprot:TRINITY_DN8846_c0_g1_i1.p1 TRINITY_DN8846_c0_g1~~TRINITY_DN8846_c0_g1_i1.p1  ORF type:complete len:141 (+),score=40.01 TRINITY_DN8846_c0_g1_i1:208-630(+)